MIQISKEKPLMPETYIPWGDEPGKETVFIQDHLVSLEGHKLWNELSREQQTELGRLEVVQVMYSYAWAENLACCFFNRHLLNLDPASVEHRFLIRMLIEEFRHQEMFGMAIEKLGRRPEMPNRFHRIFGNMTVRFFPPSVVFMSVLSFELLADVYAKAIRKDHLVYSVIRKSSELHHIEEGRHIFYTKSLLKEYTDHCGWMMSTLYSIVVLLNLYFMRSLYVQKRFFMQLGVDNPGLYYRTALKHYKIKFSKYALEATLELVNSFNGFNLLTKPFWNWVLKVKQ
jgi:hypothetical protein